MSRESHDSSKIVDGKAALVNWFRESCTMSDNLLMGTEHEKPPFYLLNGLPVPYRGYKGTPGLRDVLEEMVEFNKWEPSSFEGDNLVEIKRDQVSWTLEPGGQMETSGAPCRDAHAVADETDKTIFEMTETAEKLGIGLLAMGYHPTHAGKDMPLMPKSRYQSLVMFFQHARHEKALDHLCCTSSDQVSIGYSSEEDMVKKLRVALSLQPVVTALFANSPFKEGGLSGYQSYRSHVIRGHMDERWGSMLPMAFEEGFGFEKFVDYALNKVLLSGIYLDHHFVLINQEGVTFQDFIDGKLAICPGKKATLQDWENHLNTIWPEVRVRRSLEMRGADNGPAEMIKALPAFWAGILYDRQSLDAAYEMVRDWTEEEREYLRTMTPVAGLKTPFMSHATTVQELARNALALAEGGLKRRARLNEKGEDESVYLKPLHDIAQSGKTLADRLIDLYKGEWKEDIKKIFQVMNYKNASKLLAPKAESYPGDFTSSSYDKKDPKLD